MKTAPILFISSNPSISHNEDYPTSSWSDDQIIDFFENRFGGGKKAWTDAKMRHRLRGEEEAFSSGWTRFWAAVKKRAEELLEHPATPGVDYALTEVVHCKSKGGTGVREAVRECIPRYLEPILEESGARIIVCLGKTAARALRRERENLLVTSTCGPLVIGGRSRMIVFLPHPNARKNRTARACLSTNELARLRQWLHSARH